MRNANTDTYSYGYADSNSAAYSHTKTQSDTQGSPIATSAAVREPGGTVAAATPQRVGPAAAGQL